MVLAPRRHRLIREAILGSQQTRRNGAVLIRSIEIGTFHATGISEHGPMPQDDEVATLSRVTQLREPWSERAVAKSGKPQAPQMGRDHISVAKPFLRSRGPSGLPRSAKSGKRRRSGYDHQASTT